MTSHFKPEMLKPCDIMLVSRLNRGFWVEAWEYIKGLPKVPWKPSNVFPPRYVSKSIQIITGSPWNHVGGVYSHEHIIEALDRVKMSPMSKYFDEKKYKIKILRYKHFDNGDIILMKHWLQEQLEAKYDYGAIIRLGLSLGWARLFKLEISLKDKYPDKWICSELIQGVMRVSGVNIKSGIMLPKDFDRADIFKTIWES